MTRVAQVSLGLLLVANLLVACSAARTHPQPAKSPEAARIETRTACEAPDPAAMPTDRLCRTLDDRTRECLSFVGDGSVLLVGEAPKLALTADKLYPSSAPEYEVRYFATGCWRVEGGELAVTLDGGRALEVGDYAPRPSWIDAFPP